MGAVDCELGQGLTVHTEGQTLPQKGMDFLETIRPRATEETCFTL